MIEHLGWAFCDMPELVLAILDGVAALEWESGFDFEGGPFVLGEHDGCVVDAIGDFFTPIWRADSTIYLAGHHSYADDDIESFGDGWRDWSDELIAAVGARLIASKATGSTTVATLDVPSGCLAFIDPLADAPLAREADIRKVIDQRGTFKAARATFVAVDAGTYEVVVEELDEVDEELGTFNARVAIAKV